MFLCFPKYIQNRQVQLYCFHGNSESRSSPVLLIQVLHWMNSLSESVSTSVKADVLPVCCTEEVHIPANSPQGQIVQRSEKLQKPKSVFGVKVHVSTIRAWAGVTCLVGLLEKASFIWKNHKTAGTTTTPECRCLSVMRKPSTSHQLSARCRRDEDLSGPGPPLSTKVRPSVWLKLGSNWVIDRTKIPARQQSSNRTTKEQKSRG